jgi:hypothetical protein
MKVFISYRRSDTQDFSGRLADCLDSTPGISHVFIDVNGIQPGDNFEARIRAALDQCDAVIIVIGPNWCGKTDGSASKIFRENDFVRLETRLALESPIRVFPVLANNSSMPPPADVPDDLRPLLAIHATRVRHSDFQYDTTVLVDALFSRKKPDAVELLLQRFPVLAAIVRSFLGSCVAMALLVVALAIFNSATGKSLSNVLGGAGPVLIFVSLVVMGGAAAPWLMSKK